jgi:hypothetical protein
MRERGSEEGGAACRIPYINSLQRKLVFERELEYPHHRSGWPYAQKCLRALETPDRAGILLDAMVERNFAKELELAIAEERIPYRRPWIGIVHVPVDLPAWSDVRRSPARLLRSEMFEASLPNCRGLVTLTSALAAEIRSLLPEVPVATLYHPTEFSGRRWRYAAYVEGGETVVQVGFWLRRLSAIHFLDVDSGRKRVLLPFQEAAMARYLRAAAEEGRESGAPPFGQWQTGVVDRLADGDYDALLERSLVFLNLYNAAASNTVIECMVRATPVLVNRLPALEEYLGAAYPLFYTDMEEAGAMARDRDRVAAAHEYLAGLDLRFLTGERFVRGLAESAMYRAL